MVARTSSHSLILHSIHGGWSRTNNAVRCDSQLSMRSFLHIQMGGKSIHDRHKVLVCSAVNVSTVQIAWGWFNIVTADLLANRHVQAIATLPSVKYSPTFSS